MLEHLKEHYKIIEREFSKIYDLINKGDYSDNTFGKICSLSDRLELLEGSKMFYIPEIWDQFRGFYDSLIILGDNFEKKEEERLKRRVESTFMRLRQLNLRLESLINENQTK